MANHNEFVVCFYLERSKKVQVFTCYPFEDKAQRFKFEHKKKWIDVCAMEPIDFLKNDERNSLGAQTLKLASSGRFPNEDKVHDSNSSDNLAFFKSRLHTMKKDMVLLDTHK